MSPTCFVYTLLMSSPENERRLEADLSAHLSKCETIPVQAIFAAGRIATFFGVTPSVVTNWASRYPEFPSSINTASSPKLYDIRAVVRWWIHWHPENKKKAGTLPEDWFRHL